MTTENGVTTRNPNAATLRLVCKPVPRTGETVGPQRVPMQYTLLDVDGGVTKVVSGHALWRLSQFLRDPSCLTVESP